MQKTNFTYPRSINCRLICLVGIYFFLSLDAFCSEVTSVGTDNEVIEVTILPLEEGEEEKTWQIALNKFSPHKRTFIKSLLGLKEKEEEEPEKSLVLNHDDLVSIILNDHQKEKESYPISSMDTDPFNYSLSLMNSISYYSNKVRNLSEGKKHFEKWLESIGPIGYNKIKANVFDVFSDKKLQCFSGTLLYLHFLVRANKVSNEDLTNLVVSFSSGHVFAGITDIENDQLHWIESTDTNEVFRTTSLSQKPHKTLLISSYDFLFEQALIDGVEEKDEFKNWAIQRANKKFNLETNRPRATLSFVDVLNYSIFAFGRAIVPDGDLERTSGGHPFVAQALDSQSFGSSSEAPEVTGANGLDRRALQIIRDARAFLYRGIYEVTDNYNPTLSPSLRMREVIDNYDPMLRMYGYDYQDWDHRYYYYEDRNYKRAIHILVNYCQDLQDIIKKTTSTRILYVIADSYGWGNPLTLRPLLTTCEETTRNNLNALAQVDLVDLEFLAYESRLNPTACNDDSILPCLDLPPRYHEDADLIYRDWLIRYQRWLSLSGLCQESPRGSLIESLLPRLLPRPRPRPRGDVGVCEIIPN